MHGINSSQQFIYFFLMNYNFIYYSIVSLHHPLHTDCEIPLALVMVCALRVVILCS